MLASEIKKIIREGRNPGVIKITDSKFRKDTRDRLHREVYHVSGTPDGDYLDEDGICRVYGRDGWLDLLAWKKVQNEPRNG